MPLGLSGLGAAGILTTERGSLYKMMYKLTMRCGRAAVALPTWNEGTRPLHGMMYKLENALWAGRPRHASLRIRGADLSTEYYVGQAVSYSGRSGRGAASLRRRSAAPEQVR